MDQSCQRTNMQISHQKLKKEIANYYGSELQRGHCRKKLLITKFCLKILYKNNNNKNFRTEVTT